MRVGPDRLLHRWLLAGPLRARTGLWLSSEDVGAIGEELAARWLRREGARLLGRNVLAPEGELDLVAADGDALVVVEVKAGWTPARWGHRRSWRPALRVRPEALGPRARAARRIGRRTGRTGRVDVVEVWAIHGERRARLRRWEDVRAVARLGTEARSSQPES